MPLPLPALIVTVLVVYFAVVLALGGMVGSLLRRHDREPVPTRLHDRDPYERQS